VVVASAAVCCGCDDAPRGTPVIAMTRIYSPTPFPSPSSQRAASTDGEASGIIDIRTMGPLFAANDARVEVPQFSGLTISPASPEPTRRAPTGPVAAVPRSQTPLYALLGALTLGVIGLAGFVVTRPPPETQQIVHIIKQQPLAENIRREEPAEPTAAVVDEPEAAPEIAEPAVGKEQPRKGPRKPGKPGEPAKVGEKVGEKTPVVEAPKPASKPDYDVDCILGKSACKDRPAPKVEEPTKPAPVPQDSLPEKLEQADISAGTGAARAAAASKCARLAKGGEKVQVKLSIAGPTGAVIGTGVLDDAGNAGLASCVAKELEQASFRKVQKQQMGTVVTVKF
jgi:hypothetical protein